PHGGRASCRAAVSGHRAGGWGFGRTAADQVRPPQGGDGGRPGEAPDMTKARLPLREASLDVV
ncbi:MAG: hypothetical protein ACXV0U_07805, partial [Kineosporiaceae bacterium]